MPVFNIVNHWENVLDDGDHIVQTETVLHTNLKLIKCKIIILNDSNNSCIWFCAINMSLGKNVWEILHTGSQRDLGLYDSGLYDSQKQNRVYL